MDTELRLRNKALMGPRPPQSWEHSVCHPRHRPGLPEPESGSVRTRTPAPRHPPCAGAPALAERVAESGPGLAGAPRGDAEGGRRHEPPALSAQTRRHGGGGRRDLPEVAEFVDE